MSVQLLRKHTTVGLTVIENYFDRYNLSGTGLSMVFIIIRHNSNYLGNAPLFISMHVPFIYSGLSVASQYIVLATSSGLANLSK